MDSIPVKKLRTPINKIMIEKVFENPVVSFPLVMMEKCNPRLSPNAMRKMVVAVEKVKPIKVITVGNFRLAKSFMGKPNSLICYHNSAIFHLKHAVS